MTVTIGLTKPALGGLAFVYHSNILEAVPSLTQITPGHDTRLITAIVDVTDAIAPGSFTDTSFPPNIVFVVADKVVQYIGRVLQNKTNNDSNNDNTHNRNNQQQNLNSSHNTSTSSVHSTATYYSSNIANSSVKVESRLSCNDDNNADHNNCNEQYSFKTVKNESRDASWNSEGETTVAATNQPICIDSDDDDVMVVGEELPLASYSSTLHLELVRNNTASTDPRVEVHVDLYHNVPLELPMRAEMRIVPRVLEEPAGHQGTVVARSRADEEALEAFMKCVREEGGQAVALLTRKIQLTVFEGQTGPHERLKLSAIISMP
eukprot:c14790_g1_i2.p1 GENE.c14790_g1_i2~~c14790_g1_i2.p1  ORF type:complete len:320 (+),score=82.23 c14790_g1_i2:647-1606(+)